MTKRSKTISPFFAKEPMFSAELLHVVKLKDIIITVDEKRLGFGWWFVCF